MKLLPLHRLGAREITHGVIEFGLFLPWVSGADGNRLWVKVIHEKDQFLPDIQPLEFELAHASDPEEDPVREVEILGMPSAPGGETRPCDVERVVSEFYGPD